MRECGGVDHECMELWVYHCQHQRAWHVSWWTGTTDAPGISQTTSFGPFDTRDDVLAFLAQLVVEQTPSPPG